MNSGLKVRRDRGVVIGEGYAKLSVLSARFVLIVLGALTVGWILAQLWVVVLPLALTAIVCSLLAPVVGFLRARGVPSGLAAGLVVLGSLGGIGLLVAVLTPQVAGQAGDIADQAAGGLGRVEGWLTDGPFHFSQGQLRTAVEAVQDRLRSGAAAIGSGVFSTISSALSVVVNLILILMLSFLLLKDGHKLVPWMRGIVGDRAGRHVATVMERCWATLGGFIRTQFVVSGIDTVLIGGALLFLDVKLAIPLAVLTFAGGFVPIVGAFISGALAVLVTLVSNEPRDALIMLGVIVVVQQLEGNVLSPILQGKSMNLHAAVVLLSVTAGGTLFGITGAFLAVPVVAMAAVVLRYVNEQVALASRTPEGPEPAA